MSRAVGPVVVGKLIFLAMSPFARLCLEQALAHESRGSMRFSAQLLRLLGWSKSGALLMRVPHPQTIEEVLAQQPCYGLGNLNKKFDDDTLLN